MTTARAGPMRAVDDSLREPPTDQGFYEWWGYRNCVDEAGWTSYATFEAIADAKGIQAPQIAEFEGYAPSYYSRWRCHWAQLAK